MASLCILSGINTKKDLKPDIVKEDYEKFLEEIKNKEISILEKHYYQLSLNKDQDKAITADEKRKKDAREKAEKALLN